MSKTSHLRPRGSPKAPRWPVSFTLTREQDQIVWEAAKAYAQTNNLAIVSLVIEALAEYLQVHPEPTGDE